MSSKKLDLNDFSRSDMYFINPDEILVDDNDNRRWLPHEDSEIDALVESFHLYGQIQPVMVQRVPNNKVKLTLGYRRYYACKKFNELYPNKPMRLKCVVTTLSQEEAALKNIAENRDRKSTSPVDDAINQRYLRDELGYTNTKIAEVYKCSPSYVSQLEKILVLDKATLLLLHKKELSFANALALADLDPQDQKDVLTTTQKPDNTTLTKKIRTRKIAQGKAQARSMKELKAFLASLTTKDPSLQNIGNTLLDYVKGSISDEDALKKMQNAFTNAA